MLFPGCLGYLEPSLLPPSPNFHAPSNSVCSLRPQAPQNFAPPQGQAWRERGWLKDGMKMGKSCV